MKRVCFVVSMILVLGFALCGVAYAAPVNISGKTVDAIETEIQGAIDALTAGGIVEVEGSITNATTTLSLAISNNVTVQWKAAYIYSGTGTAIACGYYGTFEIVTGGSISALNGTGISVFQLTLSGGSILATDGIILSGGSATVSGNVTMSGDFRSNGLTVSQTGTLTVPAGGNLKLNSYLGNYNNGKIINNGIIVINNSITFTNNSNGTVINNGIVTVNGVVNNYGHIYSNLEDISGYGTLNGSDIEPLSAAPGNGTGDGSGGGGGGCNSGLGVMALAFVVPLIAKKRK